MAAVAEGAGSARELVEAVAVESVEGAIGGKGSAAEMVLHLGVQVREAAGVM